MLPEACHRKHNSVYLLTVADVDAERLDDNLVPELGVLFPNDAEDFRFRLRTVCAVCRLPVTQKQNHFVWNNQPMFITTRQRSCRKIMFSLVSVCYSVCTQGRRGPHVTTVCDVIGRSRFTWDPLPDPFKLVDYVAHTSAGMRVVGIRLKGFLVIWAGIATITIRICIHDYSLNLNYFAHCCWNYHY